MDTLFNYRLNALLADLEAAFKGRVASGRGGSSWANNTYRDRHTPRATFIANHRHVDEVLGTGHFSIAVTLRGYPDLCVKFSLRETDAWVTFAQYCRQYPDNKYLPDIHRLGKVGNAVYAVMQRYNPVDPVDFTARPFYIAADPTCHAGCDVDEAKHYLGPVWDVIRGIARYFKGLASMDLHEGNIMLSDAGEYVIVDPVSFTSED